MQKTMDFIYKKEIWYISAFIDSTRLNIQKKVEEIKELITEKLKNLTQSDLQRIAWNKEWVNYVIDLGKHITLENIKWVTYIEDFHYHNENRNLTFNTLGYFEIEVEFFKDTPNRKETIKPVFIQQSPAIVSKILKDLCDLKINEYLNIDHESPIFVFAVSDQLSGIEKIEWTQENIEKYKRIIGTWTEIYSGSWSDYNEALYDRRIKNNLSNRLSELHFIHRNSGFIYMEEENYTLFFDGNRYMRIFVLEPTAQIRALLFAFISINESLDILFNMQTSEITIDINILEQKMDNLKLLRGRIQTQLSIIFNELDYNRRQHYTTVLSHLIDEFDLKGIIQRINDKFDVIYDSIQLIYQKRNEENQKRAERGVAILNVLFGLGILADLAQAVLALYAGFVTGNFVSTIINAILSLIIGFVLLWALYYFGISRLVEKKKTIIYAVDAVILDGKDNVVLIRRKFTPYKGQLAFPGGFIQKGEDPVRAVIREVKEETGLSIKVNKQVGVYDTEGRDPRGYVISTAFLCEIIGEIGDLKGGTDAEEVVLRPIETLRGVDLAFDHEDILKEALEF
ncbi:MAG: NUDIX domain-containing protein [Candidatus Hodarchaeota archaeon]